MKVERYNIWLYLYENIQYIFIITRQKSFIHLLMFDSRLWWVVVCVVVVKYSSVVWNPVESWIYFTYLGIKATLTYGLSKSAGFEVKLKLLMM